MRAVIGAVRRCKQQIDMPAGCCTGIYKPHQLFTKPVICGSRCEAGGTTIQHWVLFLPAFQCLLSATGTGFHGAPVAPRQTLRQGGIGRAVARIAHRFEVALCDQTGTGHKTNARLTRGNSRAQHRPACCGRQARRPDNQDARRAAPFPEDARRLQKLKLKSPSARQSPYFHRSRKHPCMNQRTSVSRP